MAELTTEYVFDGSIAEVFAGLRSYEKYPEYLPGVTGIKVMPPAQPGSVCQVRYEIKLIKSFYYTLNMHEQPPQRLWWDLHDSNIMKQSKGSWTLTEQSGGKTKAIYGLDIAFSGFVPQKIVDQITKVNLPAMMSGFQRLISDVSRTNHR